MSVIVPPIKSQGIKTKLVPWINDLIMQSGLDLPKTNWIEPFLERAWLDSMPQSEVTGMLPIAIPTSSTFTTEF